MKKHELIKIIHEVLNESTESAGSDAKYKKIIKTLSELQGEINDDTLKVSGDVYNSNELEEVGDAFISLIRKIATLKKLIDKTQLQ